jgi:hypothetical protein
MALLLLIPIIYSCLSSEGQEFGIVLAHDSVGVYYLCNGKKYYFHIGSIDSERRAFNLALGDYKLSSSNKETKNARSSRP